MTLDEIAFNYFEGAILKNLARVFPRHTKQSPDDRLAFYGPPPMLFDKIHEIHVSCTFTWDVPRALWLADQWEHIAPVKVGGPAFLDVPGGDFTPGMYLKKGVVITSRGCPNKCWFCNVWRRDGNIRELPITEGWNVQDDNLLACSEQHIRSVFAMLSKQHIRPTFSGGLEAKRLKEWHVHELALLKPKQLFFAYDEPADYEPLVEASKLLRKAGFNRHKLRCYVLIGAPRDTIGAAEKRLRQTIELGFFPSAMLYHNDLGKYKKSWSKFQRTWHRPAAIAAKLHQENNKEKCYIVQHAVQRH